MRFTFALTVLALVGCQEPPALSTTEHELVNVYTPATDFGTLQVGQTSAPLVTYVSPASGANYDLVTAVGGCGDFVVDAQGLPAEVYRTCEIIGCVNGTGNREEQCPIVDPGDNLACPTADYLEYSFSTSFHPSVAGPQSCAVTIYFSDGAQRTVSLSGYGVPPPIDIDVSPGSIAFGDVRRDTTSNAATVTARNLGGSTLTIGNVAVSGPFGYAGPTSSVPPGGLVQYSVSCHPTTVGGVVGTFTIQSDDPSTPTINVPLSCNGVDSNLDISPSPAALVPTRVGEPIEQIITIGNSGAVATTLESVALAGAGIAIISGPTMPLPLGPGATTQVLVRFEATAAGEASGTLTVLYEGGRTRTSQITARAVTATMSLDPDGEVDFGPVCSGQTRSRSFTVLGTTDGGFQITQITEPGAPFIATLPAVPIAVEPLGANQIKFDLEVVPEAAGPIVSTLTLVTDIPGAEPRQVQLMATALAPGIGATPEIVDLGSNEIDTTTFGQPVDITNCTDAPITITGARIEGVDAADFAIVATPQSSTVMPTLSGRYLVVFSARTTGQKHAEMIVEHSAGTTIIPLDGEGLGPLDLVEDRGSYYACSSGGLAGWPVMLVLLALCWRRRR
ncbi:MAG: choice-of-anchor D domain-containing protein [Kofleriaceae bacterium]